MARLPAARVASEFYDSATVVDRDRLPDHPANRKGVPQLLLSRILLADLRDNRHTVHNRLAERPVDTLFSQRRNAGGSHA